MRFIPFRLKDHPYIEDDLSSIAIDLAIARLGKNAICSKDRIVFSASFAQGMKSVEVPLDEQGYKNANLSLAEKMCLRRIVELLEQADENDLKLVQARYGSQFEVVRAIRSIDQNFGGKRFVDIACDIIESNMGLCLYPYMASDLVLSLYLAYNKNVNRDIDGFMSSIVDFMSNFIENERDLRTVLQDIQEKSSGPLYLRFLEFGVKNDRLLPALSEAIVDLFAFPYDYRVNHAAEIPVSILAAFPKGQLIAFFMRVNAHYDEKVGELLSYLGKDCDPEYLYAYQRNPQCDSRLLVKSPAFGKLDPEKVEEMKLREWMSAQYSGRVIVHRFEEITDLEAQKRFLKVLEEIAGWEELAHALNGESCSMRRFDYDTFASLLPHLNLDIDRNRVQAIAFVRDIIDYNSSNAEKVLLSLYHPSFAAVVREALSKQKIRDFPTQVILADRFHCPDAIQIKEWH